MNLHLLLAKIMHTLVSHSSGFHFRRCGGGCKIVNFFSLKLNDSRQMSFGLDFLACHWVVLPTTDLKRMTGKAALH